MDSLLENANLGELLKALWLFFSHGGFAIFVGLGIWLLYILYIDEIQEHFLEKQKWVFLSIKSPRVNLQSSLAVEQVYVQMHSLLSIINFPAKYIEGKLQLWYSLELVSLGGKINFIVRAPAKMRDIVESAFYAEYPSAEITEVSDYLANVEFDPESSDFDISGSEYKLADHQALPLRSYKEFEHIAAEEKIIDPLKQVFESMTRIEPHEMYSVQLLIAPVIDKAWKPESEAKAKDLIADKKKPKDENFWVSTGKLAIEQVKILFGSTPTEEKKEEARELVKLTEVEKNRVNLVLTKVTKPGYLVKVRHLFLAPKDLFNADKPGVVSSAYRSFGSPYTNQMFPDGETGTKLPYKLSETLEKPYLDFMAKKRKTALFKAFKTRDFYSGTKPFVLNVEEIATLYHLPLLPEEATRVPMETSDSKKSQPPIDLPFGEY